MTAAFPSSSTQGCPPGQACGPWVQPWHPPSHFKLLVPLSSLSAPSAHGTMRLAPQPIQAGMLTMRSWACPLRAQQAGGAPPSPPPLTINKWGWGPGEARPLLRQLLAISALQLMGWGGGPTGTRQLGRPWDRCFSALQEVSGSRVVGRRDPGSGVGAGTLTPPL